MVLIYPYIKIIHYCDGISEYYTVIFEKAFTLTLRIGTKFQPSKLTFTGS